MSKQLYPWEFRLENCLLKDLCQFMCMFRNGIKFAWLVFADMACLFAATRHVLSEEDSRNQRNAFYAHSAGVFTAQVANPTLLYIFELFQLFFPACRQSTKQNLEANLVEAPPR